jgi:hypothetical protein
MIQNKNGNYYTDRMDKYWSQFGRLIQSSNRILPGYTDGVLAGSILVDTKSNFKTLLCELPWIGGDSNPLMPHLISGAVSLAYIRVLEMHGIAAETIGEIILKVYEDAFSSMPGVVKWFFRRQIYSRGRLHKLSTFAAESTSNRYPGNWVMEYIPGDGMAFDFGYNMKACAILEFFRRMDAGRYMPYLCATDHTASRAVGTGLHRTQTLSNGGDCCDFRFTKGYRALPGLPLEGLPEYQHRKH